jgi:HPt (histidine-containing phosphotransfer) domain-containing protein
MTAEVRQALDKRWPRVREAAHAELVVMEEFAQSGEVGTALQRDAACGAAHKLSGSLGMFGRREASAVAAAIEDLLGTELTAVTRRELCALVDRLEQLIDRDDSLLDG